MSFIADKKMPPDMLARLRKFGDVFLSVEVNTKDKGINSHPDLQIHFIDDNTAVTAPQVYEHYKKILPKTVNIKKGISEIGFTYPQNCAYNIVRLGKTVICNSLCAERTILDFYTEVGYRIINVKQGYAKCNVCPISDNAFITEDRGIYKTVKNANTNIEIYLINPGSVRLDGFEYGFIGGASGLCGNGVIFCGNSLSNAEIAEILDKKGINAITLSDGEMYDYGSIISF